jgi:predicted RNase H-like nuclease (RuvC/YqgF family)
MNANIIAEILEKNKPEIEKANAYIKSLEDEIKALKLKIDEMAGDIMTLENRIGTMTGYGHN